MSLTALSPLPRLYEATSTGAPAAGYLMYTAQPGTVAGPGQSFPKASYNDSTGQVANSNPVIFGADGRADVWLNGSYSVALYDPDGNLIYTVDNVTGAVTSGYTTSGASTVQIFADATLATYNANILAANDALAPSYYEITKIDGTTNLVTISPGSGTVGGQPSVSISNQYGTVRLVKNATLNAWYVVGGGWVAAQNPGANQVVALDGNGNLTLAGETFSLLDKHSWSSTYQIGGDRNFTMLRGKGTASCSANLYNDGTSYRYLADGTAALLTINSSGLVYLYTAPSGTAGAVATLSVANTIWHSGNDGAGSGLDADTVDGVHGATFLQGLFESNLKAARGLVLSSGAVSSGNGFTVNHTGTGLYTISLTTAFAENPAVVATCDGYQTAIVTAISGSSFIVHTGVIGDGTMDHRDVAFSFVAMGV